MKRDVLPLRRRATHLDFTFKGTVYSASLGYYHDGRLGEVFLRAGKSGTDLQVQMRDAAILISFALQHGVEFDTIHKAFTRDAEGKPEAPLAYLLDLIAAESKLRSQDPLREGEQDAT